MLEIITANKTISSEGREPILNERDLNSISDFLRSAILESNNEPKPLTEIFYKAKVLESVNSLLSITDIDSAGIKELEREIEKLIHKIKLNSLVENIFDFPPVTVQKWKEVIHEANKIGISQNEFLDTYCGFSSNYFTFKVGVLAVNPRKDSSFQLFSAALECVPSDERIVSLFMRRIVSQAVQALLYKEDSRESDSQTLQPYFIKVLNIYLYGNAEGRKAFYKGGIVDKLANIFQDPTGIDSVVDDFFNRALQMFDDGSWIRSAQDLAEQKQAQRFQNKKNQISSEGLPNLCKYQLCNDPIKFIVSRLESGICELNDEAKVRHLELLGNGISDFSSASPYDYHKARLEHKIIEIFLRKEGERDLKGVLEAIAEVNDKTLAQKTKIALNIAKLIARIDMTERSKRFHKMVAHFAHGQ